MAFLQRQDHWFAFRDACVSVLESVSVSSRATLFFLHGRFGHAHMWGPVMSRLSGRFRSVAINLPGFGYSFTQRERSFSMFEHAALVVELIQKLTRPDDPVVLVGHDIGGGIAQYCLYRQPEKISSLVLINPVCLNQEMAQQNTGFAGCLKSWSARKRLNRLIQESYDLDDEFKKSLMDLWKTRSFRSALLHSWDAIEDSWPGYYERQTWKKEFLDFSQPVLVLWGRKDSLNASESATELVQRLREPYFFVHEESGHWPCLEQTDWVVTKMREFIFRTEYQTIKKVPW